MKLDYFQPRADLAPYARCYYRFASPISIRQPLCAELGNIRIVRRGGGQFAAPDGPGCRLDGAFITGPTMGASFIATDPGTDVFGVGVTPLGWSRLIGFAASEARDAVFDFEAIASARARRCADALVEAPSDEACVRAADQLIDALMAGARATRRDYPAAIEAWLGEAGDPGLDRLTEMLEVSSRQADRLAAQFFGASPKRLQRKYRALRAADRLLAGAADWRDAAGPAYVDQSHFIRDFKVFVGLTPGAFRAGASLMRAVRERRHSARGAVALADI